jgi:curved DNA-binding protein CbpA
MTLREADDHYAVLGVHPEADHDTIRAAYLRVMREHHPDHRPGDRVAEEVARRANAAWEVLGSALGRAAYDRVRAARTGPPRAEPPRVDTVDVTPRPAPAQASYSADQTRFREDFSAACMRMGLLVFSLGILLLVLVAAR